MKFYARLYRLDLALVWTRPQMETFHWVMGRSPPGGMFSTLKRICSAWHRQSSEYSGAVIELWRKAPAALPAAPLPSQVHPEGGGAAKQGRELNQPSGLQFNCIANLLQSCLYQQYLLEGMQCQTQ